MKIALNILASVLVIGGAGLVLWQSIQLYVAARNRAKPGGRDWILLLAGAGLAILGIVVMSRVNPAGS